LCPRERERERERERKRKRKRKRERKRERERGRDKERKTRTSFPSVLFDQSILLKWVYSLSLFLSLPLSVLFLSSFFQF
jgi:hypothetical protein